MPIDSAACGSADFELRLIAIALVVAWSVAAGLVLLAYRPGGPFDLVVGLTAMIADRDRAGRRDLAAGRTRRARLPRDRRGSGSARCSASCPPSRASSPSCWRMGRGRSCPRRRLPTRGCWRSLRRACSAGSGSPAGCPAATAPRGPRLAGGVAIALFVTTLGDDRLLGRRGRQRPGPARRRRERVAVRPDRRRARTAVVRRAAQSPAPRPVSSCTCRGRSTFTRSDRST